MDRDRWERVWEIFEEALGRLEPERRAFLDEACGDDRPLRKEVESLLASHLEAGSFIERAVGEEAEKAAAGRRPRSAPPSRAPGDRIGSYEILRPLGRGGMGEVYLAVRADDEYRQEVAIKLMRVGMDSPDLAARFRSERQILADLTHPHIARLLDGGTTESGSSYVVMEYVRGEPLDAWCSSRNLEPLQRLRLFRQVCEAVQYAHRNLVVHRDIKPGNILVTAEGAPKLLDFGIAKLLTRGGRGAPETRATSRLLTPEYASPEQIRGESVTTATDVYSLGVLLYELLTGRLPYRVTSGSQAELERAICETDPEKPSTAVTGTEGGEAAETASRAPGTPQGISTEALRRELRGDLDNIILMALRKEPERRYASVSQLSEDIQRYLDGHPVIARKDTWSYRTAKFISRNRWGVAAAASIVALLAFLAADMTIQSIRIARERDRADREAVTAERVSEFLVELFSGVDPAEAQGREVTAREILDQGVRRVRQELDGEPVVQARLLESMGRIYSSLGKYDEAGELLEHALRRRVELFGDDHTEVARAKVSLGNHLRVRGKYDQAEEQLAAALEILRRHLPPGDPGLLSGLAALGHTHVAQAKHDEAERAYQEALDIARAAHGGEHEDVAQALANLGVHREMTGRYQEAEGLFLQALEMQERLLGEAHPSLLTTMNLLASMHRKRGRFQEAEATQLRQLELTRKVYGDEHARVATSLNNLASTYKESGELQEAERAQREAMAIYQATVGEDHYLVGMSMNNLANILHDQGDLQRAEAMHRRSLAFHKRVLGDEHPRVADCLNNLANLLWDKGDYDAAEPVYREALALDIKTLGEDHPYVAMDLSNLSLVLRDRGDLQASLDLIERAVDVSSRALGADDATTALYIGGVASVYLRMGRLEEAREKIAESLGIQEAKLPEGHWRIQQTRSIQGEILAAAGRAAEGEALMKEAFEELEKQLGAGSGFTRRARERLRRFYLAEGRTAEAAAYESSR